MKILKFIRKTPFLNKVFRGIILFTLKLFRRLAKKWRVSGVVSLSFNGQEFKMFSNCDDSIVDSFLYDNSYSELNDLNVFTRLIKPQTIIFDVGANTGIYSIICSTVSSDSVIHSFEPNPTNLERLKKNLSLNHLKNVKIVPKAVGEINKETDFYIPQNNAISDSSSVVADFSKATYGGEIAWKKTFVQQTSLDNYCQENSIKKVDLIKIDVENYEIEVLKGAIETIKQHAPIILLETFIYGDKRLFLENLIEENNYFTYLIFKQGIVKTSKKFEQNKALNYLIMPLETENTFTPMEDLPDLVANK